VYITAKLERAVLGHYGTSPRSSGKCVHFGAGTVTNGVSAFQRSINEFIKKHRLKKVYAYLDDLTVTGETRRG